MSAGKCAAQGAHAETLAMHDYFNCTHHVHELDDASRRWVNDQCELYSNWFGYGHYAKYIMKADDSTQMHTINHYIRARGFRAYLVVDEGHTEDTWMVPTALAVELVDKDDERTVEVFSNFRMYREPRPKSVEAASSFDIATGGPFRRALRELRG